MRFFPLFAAMMVLAGGMLGVSGNVSDQPEPAAEIDVLAGFFKDRETFTAVTVIPWMRYVDFHYTGTDHVLVIDNGRSVTEAVVDADNPLHRQTFMPPGIYDYFCKFHGENGMKGVVVVRKGYSDTDAPDLLGWNPSNPGAI